MTVSTTDQTRDAIAATVQGSRVCSSILLFFLENEHAMDTANGIASCWIGCDELEARAALERLLAHGVVAVCAVGGRLYYRLTKDAELVAWLRTARETGAWANSGKLQRIQPIENVRIAPNGIGDVTLEAGQPIAFLGDRKTRGNGRTQ